MIKEVFSLNELLGEGVVLVFLIIWLIFGVVCFLAIPDGHDETWMGRAIRAAAYGFAITLLAFLLNSVGCSGVGGSGEYRFSS